MPANIAEHLSTESTHPLVYVVASYSHETCLMLLFLVHKVCAPACSKTSTYAVSYPCEIIILLVTRGAEIIVFHISSQSDLQSPGVIARN